MTVTIKCYPQDSPAYHSNSLHSLLVYCRVLSMRFNVQRPLWFVDGITLCTTRRLQRSQQAPDWILCCGARDQATTVRVHLWAGPAAAPRGGRGRWGVWGNDDICGAEHWGTRQGISLQGPSLAYPIPFRRALRLQAFLYMTVSSYDMWAWGFNFHVITSCRGCSKVDIKIASITTYIKSWLVGLLDVKLIMPRYPLGRSAFVH